ncbi:cytochrome c [Marinobacterium sp. D7]|uniref:c-type cytochrome n=1 Tax=Marinobacterium ramblicola TaxID=2849041 RepID=UPI001C2DE841|nr:cytochrome c [Marinobacterium ramblicola]MBV1787993.1 cytochrome c [Marinobacterium ramblicola]
MNTARLVALPLITLAVSACDGQQEPGSNSTNGMELFNYYCAGCHKESGNGSFLEGIPANRTTKMTEAQVTQLILHGKTQMPDMPSFSQLSEQQARNIAQYLLRKLAVK